MQQAIDAPIELRHVGERAEERDVLGDAESPGDEFAPADAVPEAAPAAAPEQRVALPAGRDPA